MNLARLAVELPPRLAWKRGQMSSALLYRRAFREWGARSVMVNPLKIQGAERISVGAGCAIFDQAWIASEASGDLRIGDGVYLGHRVHLHAVGRVVIGDGVMVTDDVHIGNGGHDNSAGMTVTPGLPIIIGDRVFIGQGATVLGGVSIGEGAVIGARSVVTRDVPAGSVVAGVPARQVTRSVETHTSVADSSEIKETGS